MNIPALRLLVPRIARAVALGASLLLATTASAEESEEDKKLAKELYDDARKLMDANAYTLACAKLEKAHTLVPSGAGILDQLGKCYEEDRRIASAWSTYVSLAKLIHGRPDETPERVEYLTQKTVDLAKRYSTLQIIVPASVLEVKGTVVRRDGEVVADGAWNSELAIDGGRHVVRLEVPGKVAYETNVNVLNEIDTAKVLLPELSTLVDVPPVVVPQVQNPEIPPTAPPVVEPPRVEPVRRSPAIWAWATGATGVVAMAIGAGFRIDGYVVEAEQADECGPARDACPRDFDVPGTNAQKERDFYAFVGLTVGGGALVGVGIAGLVVNAVKAPSPQNGKSAAPATMVIPWGDGRTSAGVSALGQF